MSKNHERTPWVCPKCGRVYAPWIDKCQYCGGSTITYTPPTCPYQWWCTSPYYTNTITTDSVTLNPNLTTATAPKVTLTNEVKS